MSGSLEETKKHIADYKKVAATLAVLTVLTVAVSYLDVTVPLAILIALVIATTKGSLVASVFMHLIGERSRTVHWTLALTALFWVVLMFIPLLGQADHIGVPKTLSNANAPAAHGDEAH
jgi:caa(3)-type oxidase subunit IV